MLRRQFIIFNHKIFNNCLKTLQLQRFNAHTDIKVPDYTKYMRNSLKDPTVRTRDSDGNRKAFTNSVIAAGLIMGLYATKAEIIRDVLFLAASADVLALARIEIDLKTVPEGTSATFKWRGKPLFIRRRTPEEIAVSRSVPINSLRDPATDEDRCPTPQWLVVIGVCTHLGCVPIANAGDFGPGGYYCPCHGSHFDAAGRARKGPAPTNLEIPEYKFVNDETLIVG